jgi:hypothetical protein
MKANFLGLILLLSLNTMGQYVFDSCLVAHYPFNGNANDVVESNPEVMVYPNPTSESIIIESDSKIGKITLSNIFGSIVLKQGLTSNIINLSDSKAGVYMLQVFDKKGGLIAVEKIIKK